LGKGTVAITANSKQLLNTPGLMPDAKQLPSALSEAIEEFDRWCGKHLESEQKKHIITEPLYHYTDGRGLKGIIESQTIWFTDYRHLNDPSELSYGIEKARDLMRLKETGADNVGRAFLQCLRDMLSPKNFSKLEFFITSFSFDRDELGQWRAYADNGRGYALGLQARVFTDLIRHPNVFISPVFYKTKEILDRHSLAIDRAFEIFQDAVDKNHTLLTNEADLDEFIQQFCRVTLASVVIWNCLTSKHVAYENEKEVRLIILGTSDKLKPSIKTRLRGSEIVPYIAHDLDVRSPQTILEIVTGPAAGTDAERTVRTMLSSLKVEDDEILIKPSGIPYRAF
jgi:hypothetical protein